MTEKIDPISQAIQNAAYGELNHVLQLYQSAQGFEQGLQIMAPDGLRSIVVNAANALVEVAAQIAEVAFNEVSVNAIDSHALLQWRPSMAMFSNLRGQFSNQSNLIEKSISHYEIAYNLFVRQVQTYNLDGDGNANTGGGIGAYIGAYLGGAFGSYVGASVGSWVGGNISQGELGKQTQQLCGDFSQAVQATNSFLQQMAENTFQFLHLYETGLGKITGPSLSLPIAPTLSNDPLIGSWRQCSFDEAGTPRELGIFMVT